MNETLGSLSIELLNKKSAGWIVLLLAAVNTLVFHVPLALYGVDNIDYGSINGARTLFTLLVIVFVVTFVFFSSLALLSGTLLKICVAIFFIGNSVALYFISTYSVILDMSMMGNVLNTRTSESIEFLHPKLFLTIILLGLVPAWFVLKIPMKKVLRLRTLAYIAISILVGLATIYINASTTLWFDKHSKKLGGMILPWSYVINSARAHVERTREKQTFALLPLPTSIGNEKTVVVLVIGETARASNFSMYGYERQTNPKLSATGAIALQNSTACSTYTTASIHCMLSHSGAARGFFEPLPSYLQRSNVDVLWRTNNWGEPDLSVGEYTKAPALREKCTGKQCGYDEVLLTGLSERIEASERNKVFVVLHTKGSHGPSYHTRYPGEYEVFKPVCKSVELDKCSQAELVNAYDNTIVYTDHFLQQTINQLKQLTDTPTLMMYVSDHGESLGEYGLYLHGTPNAIAPAVQLEIPFVIWMSDLFKQSNKIHDNSFVQTEYSHQHVFHSVMGALGIRSGAYDKAWDIFDQSQ